MTRQKTEQRDEKHAGITAVRHVGIVVSNLERSLVFYRDLLGMEVWADFVDESPYLHAVSGVPGARVRMIKMKAKDGVSIELLEYQTHPQPEPPIKEAFRVGCQHPALQVEDIDALYKKLTAAGVSFHSPPLVSSDGGAKVTYCRDPDHGIVELVQILKKSN